ncbi:MAG: transglutaminase family protein [Synoicihabitans sp.]
MRFHIHHRTHYLYAGEAWESFMEARLKPAETDTQKLHAHRLEIDPQCNVHEYSDYFGNTVQTFSIVRRHGSLTLDSFAELETFPSPDTTAASDVSISEARQIYRSEILRYYEFLHPSAAIAWDSQTHRVAKQLFRPTRSLGEAVIALNSWIYQNFQYRSGSTHLGTTVAEVMEKREGVCQDFAQVMIAVLRSAEIPARYVVGYIETDSQRKAAKSSKRARKLVGAAESHAWVEVCLPGGTWWPLDPTNDCEAGERHVRVGIGRDFHDCTPTRGVFKGTHTQNLAVSVQMVRQ